MAKTWRIIPLLALHLFLWLGSHAQDINVMLEEGRQLAKAFHDKEALDKYLQVIQLQPNNLTALCAVSELYSILGKRQPAKDQKKAYYIKARTYAKQALAANSRSSEANIAMAIAMGRMALLSSGEEKIKAVKDIKTYAEKSIQYDANNYKAYHVLGKWHYEVSDLNGVEKLLVKVIYEALPPASLDEAIRYYEKSIQLNKQFLLNYLELAKACHRKENKTKAISLLNTLLGMPNTFTDDNTVKSEARKLLKEWKK